MNVLSLFDGMSCGHIALDRLGIKVDKYYSAEIDKYAMKVTDRNYPGTIQLGDVNQVYGKDLPKIDLLLGGSPCQGFSYAGKQLNFNDPRSALFFEFVRLLKECKPKYFLLENVVMQQEFQDVISQYVGVKPIFINSSVVSAQNRQRLYWTNAKVTSLPEDKRILLKDILEYDAANEFSEPYVKLNGRDTGEVGHVGKRPKQATRIYSSDNKSQCLLALGGGQGAKTGLYQIDKDPDNPQPKRQVDIFDGIREKSRTVRAGGRLSYCRHEWDSVGNKNSPYFYRKLTVTECERLQTVPDGYTEGVSMTQRYKMLGNGWTVDVIVHLLKNIKEETL